ncbi:response regulator transcription factor [Burkholderia diffusa]|uniref:response regulator transcription factor n=1 Tax=Burkholderia diffusa TaxID=488732 RepID=UPI002ABDB23F|nr:response regulator transcription factor [Burkholderia diffusa]
MTVQILVVEPDESVRDTLRACFNKYRIEMSVLYDPSMLLTRIEKEPPSAIVMRVERPVADVHAAIGQLRAAGYEMPVVMVSQAADTVDKIVAFELGADDYLVDPVDPMELVARVRCILRRCVANSGTLPEARKHYQFGDIEVDFLARRARRGGRDLGLRASEFALLKVFVLHPMRVLSRVNILSLMGKRVLERSERGLDVLVFRLRTLIQCAMDGHHCIQTVRGRGYIFVPPEIATASEPRRRP